MCELPVRGLVKRRRFGIRGSRLKASIRNAAQVVGGVGTDRAALHGQTPTAEHLFADDTVLDPEERLLKANAVMHDYVWGNQMQMQLVLARLLDQAPGASNGPARIASSEPSYGINSDGPCPCARPPRQIHVPQAMRCARVGN